jgi:uncharacterized membrane protein YedE/YeeE
MWIILISGFIFGAALQIAKLNHFNTIVGQALLENYAVAKTILFTIGLSSILFGILNYYELAEFHIKPFILFGVLIGGLLFGIGMSILGYCPGTMVVSAGNGSLDAIFGIIGGLVGGFLYSILFPYLEPFYRFNYGEIGLYQFVGNKLLYLIWIILIGTSLIVISFIFNKKNKIDNKWILSAFILASLNIIISLKDVLNRPIGASTAFPYAANIIIDNTQNQYFQSIMTPGNWELVFLLGALISGIILSITTRAFEVRLMHDLWIAKKGTNKTKRILYSLLGGFILIIGARFAGGCTSGHVISGGMQIAFSSFTFAFIAFITLIIFGRKFYKS